MDRLVDAALAGTASIGNRQIAGNTPTAALVAQLSDLSPARRLLLAAGTQALYTQAGRAVGPPVAAPAPAPPDRLPVCSTGAARLLDQLLDQDSAGILPEALGRLARVGQRLPPPPPRRRAHRREAPGRSSPGAPARPRRARPLAGEQES